MRLNHAVLYVSDVSRSERFYADILGFEVMAREGPMVFMRAPGSDNHHDLGLFGLGTQAAAAAPGTTGLYHLAWQVPHIEDLASTRERLQAAGALVGASDHGATKSIYGVDPDGTEFEVMFLLPRESWGPWANRGVVLPLDLDAELERWGNQ